MIASPGLTVKDLFARRVAAAPDAIALAGGGRHLSYGELDRGARRLAGVLARRGVGPERLVGLRLGRGVEMVVAMLAVHQAGGAYVPLDPGFPGDRLDHMVRDAGLTLVLGDGAHPGDGGREAAAPVPLLALGAALAAAGAGDAPPGVRVAPENLAYVIYTSGSTGRPKGVQVTHGALVNFLLSMQRQLAFGERDSLLAVTTLSFDIAGLEIWLPLIAGGRVEIAPREAAMDGARLAALLAACDPTALQATPVTWKLLLQAGWQGSPRLRLLCGGEALPRALAGALLDKGAGLWNLYGPTETTIWSAAARVGPGPGPVPLGQPIDATEILILDGDLQPAAGGAAGELFIGGAGLARGYRGQPALTAERFVPHPGPGAGPGARLYRTGDLARRGAGGQLEFLGRADQQVKIRGFRIELGEIEAVLREHPRVREAVVSAVPSRSGERRLVAHVVPAPGPAPEPRQLQELLARRLPEYMRPAAFAFLTTLPLTPNNKVDRRALPEVAEPVGVPLARTPTEELVLGIWGEVLECGTAGVDDDFFAAGGHSLLAGQVMARLREVLGLELPPGILFEHPTPSRLAREIDTRRRAGSGMLPPLERQARDGALPLSHAQERLWLYDQLDPGSNAFNLGYGFRLRGRPAVAALAAALAEVVRRHEILRTRIVGKDPPRQAIDAPPARVLAAIDLRALPAARREQAARRGAAAVQSAPFALARGPLLRAALLPLAADDHVLCVAVHHILCDGWSLGVLIQEMTTLYAAFAALPAFAADGALAAHGAVSAAPPGTAGAGPTLLPPPPVQYADFAAWQRRWLAGEPLEAQLAYWAERLGGGHTVATLPADRPAGQAGGALGEVARVLPGDLVAALGALGREHGATFFMTIVAAVQLLIHRYTGSERVVVGSLHANRSHSAVEGAIGFFVNVLPLATELDPGWNFRELLVRVRDGARGAWAHQDAPYEKIVERARPERGARRNPLFQVMVVLQNVPVPPLRLAGVEVAPLSVDRSTRRAAFDLTLTLVPEAGRLLVLGEYDTGLFERGTVERLLGHLDALLRDVTRDPEQRLAELPRLPAAAGAGVLPDGRLWLTDQPHAAGGEAAAAARERLAARRSRLSPRQLALLAQRLKSDLDPNRVKQIRRTE